MESNTRRFARTGLHNSTGLTQNIVAVISIPLMLIRHCSIAIFISLPLIAHIIVITIIEVQQPTNSLPAEIKRFIWVVECGVVYSFVLSDRRPIWVFVPVDEVFSGLYLYS